MPPLLTFGIAGMLALWAAYAFAGAGLIRRLPLMRLALVAISAIYLLRGAMIFMPASFNRPDLSPAFMFWSSLIVLGLGLTYAIGTWRAWPYLSGRETSAAA